MERKGFRMSKKVLATAAVLLALAQSAAQAQTILDVTPAAPTQLPGTGVIGDGFIVSNTALQSTGTGVIQPFLTIQNNGQERGFNTDVSPPPLDTKRVGGPGQPGFTSTIQLSAIPVVNIGGTNYREFLLDANQS